MKTVKTLTFVFFAGLVIQTYGAENLPKKPFGQEALIPDPQQWMVTPLYQYTEFQNVWVGTTKHNITFPEDHGFDQNDFFILTEYGFKTNWAVDLQMGFTDLATRAYSLPPGSVRHTRGLADTTFGVRYQLWNEATTDSRWTPTMTLRAGAIYRGSYEKTFPFAPGNGAVGLEIEAVAQKAFGWQGFGGYSSVGYRDIRSGGNSQYFATIGFSQKFRGVTLSAGYRHQANTTGPDAIGNGTAISYSAQNREINEQVEAGIGYTDRHGRRYQFYYQGNFSGRNTGDKDRYGVYVTFPFGGKRD